ncbi:MAG TPA: hypothetical protein DCS15_01995 [Flavobacteriales bacterium]|jgi:hypothetical protein|nr:hypothetical protein [Flavobacteriales bacterium]
MSMLELSKSVLKKVSFDRRLFRKELAKTKRWLRREEVVMLKAWCLINFAGVYDELIREVLG